MILFICSGKELANSFPAQIAAIKTNQIKIIQVPSTGGVYANVNTFSFPVEFAPTSFIRVIVDLIAFSSKVNSYTISDISTSNIPYYISSFVYIDSKFWALKTCGYGLYSGTSTLINHLDYTLATNFDYYNTKEFKISISESEVIISPSNSRSTTYFLQGQGAEKYWYVVYWN